MRKLSKLLAATTTMVAAGALVAGTVTAASADPIKTPSLTTLVGVGSDTITPLFDNGVPGNQKGTLVHDYNATKPGNPVASWDAINPATGAAGQTIITKALNSKDTSCAMARPDGSSAGIKQLDLGQTDTNKVGGQTIYCIDYARSSRGPKTTSFEDAFAALMKDAITWSFPKVKGEKNPQPKTLSLTQLVGIYTCKLTNWDQVGGSKAPIGVVIPQSGSGTRSSWMTMLGIPSTVTDEPCWQNGTVNIKGVATVIEENTGVSAGNVAQFTKTQKFPDGKTIPAADDIFPYSIGDWIAQLPASKGVGGHANSIWAHGNLHLAQIANGKIAEAPTAKNAKGQVVINPRWNTNFDRTLYGVTLNGCFVATNPTSTAVCFPRSTPPKGGTAYPAYQVKGLPAFLGPTGWICTNKVALADIMSYGFGRITGCGSLKAGD